jgi:hypothetical protein
LIAVYCRVLLNYDTFIIMETSQKEPIQTTENNRDIDLGFVLYKCGQAFKQFIYFMLECLRSFLRVIVLFLLLLKRNILWLALGCVAGLGYGFYRNSGGSTYQYSSEAIVRMNFGSVPALYNSIDYLDALIAEQKAAELSKIFSISPNEAGMIADFEVTPITSDLAVVDLYNEKFFTHKRSDLVRTDSFWTKTISFQEFKSDLTKYDYPVQKIKVVCSDPQIFSKLEQGLINLVSNNDALQQNKALLTKSADEEEKLLNRSLQDLDTLNNAYVARLLQHDANKEGTINNLLMPDRVVIKSPELELYDKILLIKDELASLRAKSVQNRDIVQVYASFNAIGEKKNVLIGDLAKHTFYGFIIAAIIVLLIALYKMMSKINPNTFMKE